MFLSRLTKMRFMLGTKSNLSTKLLPEINSSHHEFVKVQSVSTWVRFGCWCFVVRFVAVAVLVVVDAVVAIVAVTVAVIVCNVHPYLLCLRIHRKYNDLALAWTHAKQGGLDSAVWPARWRPIQSTLRTLHTSVSGGQLFRTHQVWVKRKSIQTRDFVQF